MHFSFSNDYTHNYVVIDISIDVEVEHATHMDYMSRGSGLRGACRLTL